MCQNFTVSIILSFFFVGAGIHVFNGLSPLGSQPNNSLVRPIDTTSTNPGRRRLRFHCRSNSTMRNVGELIGPGGIAINSSESDVFEISTDRNGGELEVANLVSSDDVTSTEQGVYTCRIPLQSGVMKEINIGIYPNVFNCEFIVTVNSGVLARDSSWFTGSTLGLESGNKITSVKARMCVLHRMRLKGGIYESMVAQDLKHYC